MQAAQQNAAAGSVNPVAVDPAALQALLPDTLPGGFARESVSNESGQAAGMGAAGAEGVYKRGSAQITLTVANLGPMGAMASMAGALGVSANKQDSNGYTRAQTVDGRLQTEEVDKAAATAKYAIVGHSGAMITAEGAGGASIEDVKAAVNAITITRVEQLSSK